MDVISEFVKANTSENVLAVTTAERIRELASRIREHLQVGASTSGMADEEDTWGGNDPDTSLAVGDVELNPSNQLSNAAARAPASQQSVSAFASGMADPNASSSTIRPIASNANIANDDDSIGENTLVGNNWDTGSAVSDVEFNPGVELNPPNQPSNAADGVRAPASQQDAPKSKPRGRKRRAEDPNFKAPRVSPRRAPTTRSTTPALSDLLGPPAAMPPLARPQFRLPVARIVDALTLLTMTMITTMTMGQITCSSS